MRWRGVLAGLIAVVAACSPAAALDRASVAARACGGASGMTDAANAMVASLPDASVEDARWVATFSNAAIERTLRCGAGAPTIAAPEGARDAASLRPGAPADGSPPLLSLKNRPLFETVRAAATLLAGPTAAERAGALTALERRAGSLPPELFERAAEAETDPALKERVLGVGQAALLNSPDMAKRLAAIQRIAATPDRRALTQIAALKGDPAYGEDPAFRAAVDAAVGSIERWLAVSNALNVFYNGLSFASILFMASAGLAIIFGLMGVINLAQGEFIMIGAYVAYAVQEAMRAAAPGLLDWYLIAAIPVVFLVTAGVGIAVEATIVRRLYTRPLMTLLATWAVSLLIVNLVRVAIGTQNLQFVTPSYISGGRLVTGDFIVTWNRLFAIVFAAVTLALTWFVLKKTPLGLNIRAVTQNRAMAGCVGIATRRVDMMAFGFGSGLAGLAGLALCPIYSVNPQMGSNFIVDSFMVVVLGGVGTLAGTVIAALGVGQINVLIEPLYGAVAAKVIVLLMIIAFLQWRPEGLYAVKGRRK
ncbi:urea ABC transporter permease subunit UrtB [Hansschlegelia zhihuaiae]|uniref:Urea ABC transporter permease subunit UrtB n=1 Tax=Hansschlegelia zhihuaiae TaxID=405005 RepID=A0A4Q0MMV6_9HYPH|nr:urea ABC transporter permease subunit UrtB [Hansschlegelia zhihuaiae]RXF75161.1 urea ABC transporter permease subunit UrtB [Hansschlegelia zhihuaiae]